MAKGFQNGEETRISMSTSRNDTSIIQVSVFRYITGSYRVSYNPKSRILDFSSDKISVRLQILSSMAIYLKTKSILFIFLDFLCYTIWKFLARNFHFNEFLLTIFFDRLIERLRYVPSHFKRNCLSFSLKNYDLVPQSVIFPLGTVNIILPH